MKQSQLFTKTRSEAPKDEVSKNSELLIRAGFIHKEMAGVYVFLPLGLRVLENVKKIVRDEMNKIGGQEMMMTTLQPKEIWEKTNRWDDAVVDNWFKTKLKNGTELGVGLTHEEPFVDALGEYIQSYKDLPILAYQIQNKFRNELRAKSGLLRGREFVMKDMYSFARTEEEHNMLYEKVADAYYRVYDRLGVGQITRRTFADGGIFTKKFSDEFQTFSDIGEDTIYVNEEKKVAINKEIFTDETLEKLNIKKDDLVEKKGIEVGNIFPLETKYTEALGVRYKDEKGEMQPIIMGCYGIGISRLVGVLVEIFGTEKGIVWPESVSPFKVHLVELSQGDEVLKKKATDLYEELISKGIEVLFDDRDARAGEKFADADLIGIPHRIVISKKTEEKGVLEYSNRITTETTGKTKEEIIEILK
ncbi:MAG: putative prolyl-tRNA synthetase, prolyl-tRNA synthetase [Candidatus Taylorbacteria bacterium]|nr:putative prolyl-tRNA synthetase, prolyl-tRNA synthetase [Candidatus Taylorbacteria bacterium]